MAVEFWLSRDDDKIRLPVNPASVEIARGHAHSEIKVMALGDISFPQGPDLCKYTFNSLFPAKYNPAYCEYASIKPPFELAAKIESWASDGQPVRLTITGSPINVLVTIRGFNYTPWAHSDDDIAYSLDLSEYRVPVVVRTIIEQDDSGTGTASANTPSGKTGTVNVGKGKRLNVRKTASVKGAIVGTLNHGDTVTITATVSGWHQIKTSKIAGYVSQSYIKTASGATPPKVTATKKKKRPVKKKKKGARK